MTRVVYFFEILFKHIFAYLVKHNCIFTKYILLNIQDILILLIVFQGTFSIFGEFSHMIYSLKFICKHFKSELKHCVLIKDDLIKTSS